jgi:hypothetical protein
LNFEVKLKNSLFHLDKGKTQDSMSAAHQYLGALPCLYTM